MEKQHNDINVLTPFFEKITGKKIVVIPNAILQTHTPTTLEVTSDPNVKYLILHELFHFLVSTEEERQQHNLGLSSPKDKFRYYAAELQALEYEKAVYMRYLPEDVEWISNTIEDVYGNFHSDTGIVPSRLRPMVDEFVAKLSDSDIDLFAELFDVDVEPITPYRK